MFLSYITEIFEMYKKNIPNIQRSIEYRPYIGYGDINK